MRVIDLYSSSINFAETAKLRGHRTLVVERKPPIDKIIIPKEWYRPDIIWAQIPCEAFSIAAGKHHWTHDYTPKTEKAKAGIEEAKQIIKLIKDLKPKYYFIENPRGFLRKMSFMAEFPRYTITYCQYGYIMMKPTDIWTNCNYWKPRPPCKPGDKCHMSSPSGTLVAIFSIKGGRKNRAFVPIPLCEEILITCERSIKDGKNNKGRVSYASS